MVIYDGAAPGIMMIRCGSSPALFRAYYTLAKGSSTNVALKTALLTLHTIELENGFCDLELVGDRDSGTSVSRSA
jgi:hypothetical protein